VFRSDFRAAQPTGNVSQSSKPGRELSFAPTKVSQLFVVDVQTKVISQLTTDNAIYFNPDWSPDGAQIVCASSEGRSLFGLGVGGSNIYTIDVATGRKHALTTGTRDKRVPVWSPDGRWIAYSESEHFGPESVFLVPGVGGKTTDVSASLDRGVIEFYWSADSRSIVFNYMDGVSWSIARAEIPTGRITRLSNREASRWPLSVAGQDMMAWQQSDGAEQGVIRISAHSLGGPFVLLELNPQMREWELGTQEVVRWRNRRGDELEGFLIKPVGYIGGRKYPVIVNAYPQTTIGLYADPMSGGQLLAARGYAVFFPNSRSPAAWMNPFKSADFDLAVRGPNGLALMLDDLNSGMDELIRRGVVDPDRMCLYGFSNGGAVVNQVVTMTDRFKCAVSVAAAVSTDWSLPFFLQSDATFIAQIAGATPWEDPESYMKLSAMYRLHKVNTPMLLADGDNDGLFLLSTIEMYNGLRFLGKQVTFLRYPDQGHEFTGEALKDFWGRENEFFDKYLKPKGSSATARELREQP